MTEFAAVLNADYAALLADELGFNPIVDDEAAFDMYPPFVAFFLPDVLSIIHGFWQSSSSQPFFLTTSTTHCHYNGTRRPWKDYIT